MRIYVDSELLSKRSVKNQETIKLTFDAENQWRTLQVYLKDHSGNEYWSDEIPFFVKNGEAEVKPYEKLRESAQELEQRKKLEELNLLGDFSLTIARKDGENVSLKKSTVTTETEPTESSVKKITYKSVDRSGIVLLWLGIAAFFATITGFVWTGVKRKK